MSELNHGDDEFNSTSNPFPTSSHVVLDVSERLYNVSELGKLIDLLKKNKKEAKGGAGSGPQANPDLSSSRESWFHLHTLTTQSTLLPPDELLIERFGNIVPNPSFDKFSTLRTYLQKNIEPVIPQTLISNSKDILHVPVDTRGNFTTHALSYFGLPISLPSKLKRNVRKPLFYLKYPYTQGGHEWMPGSTGWDMSNWLHASLALDPDQPQTRKTNVRPVGKVVVLESDLKICWVPSAQSSEDGDSSEIPPEIQIIITVNVYLDMSKLFLPQPDIGKELLGLILHSLIPASTVDTSRNEGEARAQALKRFFSCLKPAPTIDNPLKFQPTEMTSRLLPFQLRTVAMLLEREGEVSLDEPMKDPEGMWRILNFGKFGRMAYRRVTGELVGLDLSVDNDGAKHVIKTFDRKGKGKAVDFNQELSPADAMKLSTIIDLRQVKGTMLCEEMGLGKTVEAIALSLLHPHPLSTPRPASVPISLSNASESSSAQPRKTNPLALTTIDLGEGPPRFDRAADQEWWEAEKEAFKEQSAYDEQSQLRVSQVATTLIVTPPSLLKQWVTEIHNHAPHLRVCVYEGWKTLERGVERQATAVARERKRQQDLKRKRTNDQARQTAMQKYRRSTSSARIKPDPEGHGNDNDDYSNIDQADDDPEVNIQETTQNLFVDYVRGQDIVITTYPDLTTDLNVALPAPPRSRRSNVNYRFSSRPRSPLVMVEWWRVIMDEVQLCGDQSGSATMVSLIPRRNSLAVSGTPARTDIKDLLGSLRFLRVPTIPSDARLWHRLQQAPMREAFEGIFQAIAVRTTKVEVAGEFTIPSQTRLVVPIELSEIELHYYNDTLDRQRTRLGLSTDQSDPIPRGWILDAGVFRTCLTSLRQICTHIQVGLLNGPGGRGAGQRLQLGRELMTMQEALDKMTQDHAADILVTSRAQLRAMIRKAQLLAFDEGNDQRYLAALTLYERVRTKIAEQLAPLRRHLEELSKDRTDLLDDEESVTERMMTQQEKEHATEMAHTRMSIRESLIILHQSWFFEGDVRHTQAEVELEIDCYNKAEEIRKEILVRPLFVANTSVTKLKAALQKSRAVESLEELQSDGGDKNGESKGLSSYRGGILSHDIISKAIALLAILDDNALLVYNWRTKIVDLLQTPIDPEASEALRPEEGTKVLDPDKEYYAEALQAQGDVEAYLIAYSAAVADRKEMMQEERINLANLEARVTNKRKTQAALNAEVLPEARGEVAEQAEVLLAERELLRQARTEHDCERPLKALLMDLNGVIHGPNRAEEILIARSAADLIKAYLAKQNKLFDRLKAELQVFRSTFNRRVVYFAALQEVSDSVVVPEIKDLKLDIEASDKVIVESETKLAHLAVKGRYLSYIGQKEPTREEQRDDCIICMGSSDDQTAVLLPCGHFFCVSCFKEYRRSVGGRNCPSCRAKIETGHISRVKLGSDKVETTESQAKLVTDLTAATAQSDTAGSSTTAVVGVDPVEQERVRREEDLGRLNMMSVERRREIAQMDSLGEFGSKINFLIKHLLWYRSADHTARHVIFSNWSDSLNIVIRALTLNGIKFVSFDQGGKKGRDIVEQFIRDETITVFLLHAEKESSGLTLTACRVVHLLEPVLKHSFELQAIGRVDRLGQREETKVYCYATRDTVESRILAQGVRNGTSIYLKDDDEANATINSMPNVVGAAHKGGDVSNDGKEEELLQLIC